MTQLKKREGGGEGALVLISRDTVGLGIRLRAGKNVRIYAAPTTESSGGGMTMQMVQMSC